MHSTCRNGKWFSCRLRREFTSMPVGDRAAFVRAYKTISTRQPYLTTYRRLIQTHRVNFQRGIHGRRQFLPWHRWYLLQLENLLRRVNCSLTLPYFDWSAHSHAWSRASIWNSDSANLGGNGVCRSGRCCVQTGPFSQSQWRTTTYQCLQRQFQGSVPDMPSVQLIVDMPLARFGTFETALRGTMHDGPHCAIGGTMCTDHSADAPEFFMHHAFVDSIWWRWQSRSPARLRHFFYNSRVRLIGASGQTAHQYHNQEKLPSNVAVCYEGIDRGLISIGTTDRMTRLLNIVKRSLSRMSPSRILRLPRPRLHIAVITAQGTATVPRQGARRPCNDPDRPVPAFIAEASPDEVSLGSNHRLQHQDGSQKEVVVGLR